MPFTNPRKRVLVVEDDKAIAEAFSGSLTRWEFDVPRIAANADEALQAFDEIRPDVVVFDTDVCRAGEGVDLAAAMLAIAPAAIVFVATKLDSRLMERVKAVASLGHLIKPVSEAQLVSAVAVALDRSRTEREKEATRFSRALRFETVGALAGGIAHDFNNLLTIIGGYTESLLGGDLVQPAGRVALDGIAAAADRAAKLTQQLLAFGRRQVLQPVVMDPAAAVASVQAMLIRVLGEDVQIVTSFSPALRPVLADPSQVEQVLLNLALNARDAMPNGGILRFDVNNLDILEPRTLPSAAGVLVPRGEYVQLAVRDDGIGMEADIAARAFEPFFTTKPLGKGTGLGLSTVYGIAKQSGGFVWIDSAPGTGTSVCVLLPAAGEGEIREEKIPRHAVAARGAGTVLVVEDEGEVRAMFVESLRAAGYDVMERANGRDAIEAFRETLKPVDLIVTDVIMPHSNGPALVRAARLHQPGVRVLYMSGYADDQMLAELQNDQRSAYLQKPFGLDTLLRRVAEMLAGQPG